MKGLINIIGEIGQDVKLVDVISQVRQQPEATSFKVIIGSEGGLVSEGFDIYEYLRSLKKPVETVGVGMVASIATVIFMAGDSRKVNAGTKFMIHFPFIPEVQNATAEHFEYYAKEMKVVEKRISNFYKEKTGLETEAIDPLLRNETFLSETQLFDLGFITEKTQQIQAVAKLKTTNNMADNKQKSDLSKSILKTISDFFKGDATMKTLTTADQAEVNFPDVPDEREVAIGDIATIDGAPASGEVTMSDGRIFVFDAGTLTEIRGPEEDTDETLEEMKAEIEKLKSSLAEKDEKIDALNSEKEKAVEVINKIKMLQSSAAGSETKEKPGKGETKTERPLAGAISKLRKVN